MWYRPFIIYKVLEKGAYKLVDYDGIPLGQPHNGQDGFEFSVHICLYHVLVMHMDFYGFVDSSFHHTLNLTSDAWVLYSPAEDLVSSGAVCIGPATNNIPEYEAVIDLLTKAASQDVRDLVVLMDPQLMVCHLNHVYTIRNPVLLRVFRRVRLLERSFGTITYRHIPREHNVVADSLSNYILDWHIIHS